MPNTTSKKSAKKKNDDIEIGVELRLKKKSEDKKLSSRIKRSAKNIKEFFKKKKELRAARRATHVHLHKSFRRSYYEDYSRKWQMPGLLAHAAATFKIIFKNKKVFIPLILLMVVMNVLLVGLMSQESYQTYQEALQETNESLANGQLGNVGKAGLLLIGTITTGGLSEAMSESGEVFLFIIIVITWLVTIYLTRHILAGHKIKLRDALYNAPASFISTLAVILILFFEAIPLMIVTITYSAAVTTDFLSTPFYALVYFIFAFLLTLLSTYLLTAGIIALTAVSAPGLYPLTAVNTADDLIAGRRIRMLIRIFHLLFTLLVCWIIVMLPIIMLDNWLNASISWFQNVPLVQISLLVMTLFSVIYASVYIYLFYRWLLDFDGDDRIPAVAKK